MYILIEQENFAQFWPSSGLQQAKDQGWELVGAPPFGEIYTTPRRAQEAVIEYCGQHLKKNWLNDWWSERSAKDLYFPKLHLKGG